jgi:putrescine---pyruvate transaminase
LTGFDATGVTKHPDGLPPRPAAHTDSADLLALDGRHLLHPMTSLRRHAQQGSTIITEARGVYVTDINGNRYLDTCAGLGNAIIGYGHPEMADAISRQLRDMMFFPSAFGFSNVPAIQLAAKLAAMAPSGLTKAFFTSTGSEATETAFKIARFYHRLRGHASKTRFIARRQALHGTTYAALSASGLPRLQEWFGPLMPGFSHIQAPHCFRCDLGLTYPDCQLACADELETAILHEGPENVAAFIAEPMQAAGGHVIPPPDYYQRIRAICDQHDVLFIADEVVCGFGRTGKLFGMEHYGVTPDLMTLAKGLTSGYLPLGAVLIHESVSDVLSSTDRDVLFNHAFTYSDHATCCAAALKNIEIIERDGLVERAHILGEYFLQRLAELKQQPMVGNIAGIGLLTAIQLVTDRRTGQFAPPPFPVIRRIADNAFQAGVLIRTTSEQIVLRPPLVITTEQLDHIVDVLHDALAAVAAER